MEINVSLSMRQFGTAERPPSLEEEPFVVEYRFFPSLEIKLKIYVLSRDEDERHGV